MILLLDENLPIKLKSYFFNEFTVYTVRDLQWSGIKNGQLLKLLEDNQFVALVTMDKNLSYQHNLEKLKVFIIVINAVTIKISTLQPFVQLLHNRLPYLKNEKYVIIDLI